jgi:hypothetical protein
MLINVQYKVNNFFNNFQNAYFGSKSNKLYKYTPYFIVGLLANTANAKAAVSVAALPTSPRE